MSSYTSAAVGPRLAVAVLARDEWALAAPSLLSAKTCADELLLVDATGTEELAQAANAAGARLVSLANAADACAAPNAALDAATCEWVLILEAGEVIDAADGRGLRDFVRGEASPTQAYRVIVRSPPLQAGAASEQRAEVRLAPRAAGLRYSGALRATLRPALAKLGMDAAMMPWLLRRTSDAVAPELARARGQRMLERIESAAADEPAELTWLLASGDAWEALGEHAVAVRFYEEAVRLSERGSIEMLEGYYGALASLDSMPAARERQLALCIEALEIYPVDAQLLCVIGGYLQAQGRLDLAERSFRLALEHGQVEPNVTHIADVSELAASCLALTLDLRGERDEAQRVLESVASVSPANGRIARQLLNLLVKHGDAERALAQLDRAAIAAQQRPAMRSAVRGACLAAQENWVSAWHYLNTAHQKGCRDPLCLRWLVVTLLATGRVGAAREALVEWLAVEPRNAEAHAYLAALEQPDAAETAAAQSGGRQLRMDLPERPDRGGVPTAGQSIARGNGSVGQGPTP